jgi:hypothetical protein
MGEKTTVGTVSKNRQKLISVSIGTFEGTVYIYSAVRRIGAAEDDIPWLAARPEVAKKLAGLLKEAVTLAEAKQAELGPPENRENRPRRRDDDLERMRALKGAGGDF